MAGKLLLEEKGCPSPSPVRYMKVMLEEERQALALVWTTREPEAQSYRQQPAMGPNPRSRSTAEWRWRRFCTTPWRTHGA